MRAGAVVAAIIAVGIGVAVACSSGAKYPACERDDQCSVSGKHDYCQDGKCVYCRSSTDCADRERCRAGKCEIDPNAPPMPEAGADASDEAGDEDADTDTPPRDDDEKAEEPAPRSQHPGPRSLPQGIRRYLHP